MTVAHCMYKFTRLKINEKWCKFFLRVPLTLLDHPCPKSPLDSWCAPACKSTANTRLYWTVRRDPCPRFFDRAGRIVLRCSHKTERGNDTGAAPFLGYQSDSTQTSWFFCRLESSLFCLSLLSIDRYLWRYKGNVNRFSSKDIIGVYGILFYPVRCNPRACPCIPLQSVSIEIRKLAPNRPLPCP